MNDDIFNTILETREIISAEEYLKRRAEGRINPRDVQFIPPKLGSDGFGYFSVKLKTPRYHVSFDDGGIL